MPYCSECQLVHGEEHRFCQRCGQLLKGSQPASARNCARCGTLTFSGQKFCTECGLPLRVARVTQEDAQPPPRPSLFYPRSSEPLRRRRPPRPGRLLSLIGLVLVVLAGVYVWRHLPAKAPLVRVPPASAPQDDVRLEVEKISEKIRAAHLNKDINKWLSCYNSAYPDLGRREREMLELWKNNDIKEVSYRIGNVQRLSDKQIAADLAWNLQIYDHRTHDYTLVRLNYKIKLEKGEGGWKILESKEEAGGAS